MALRADAARGGGANELTAMIIVITNIFGQKTLVVPGVKEEFLCNSRNSVTPA
jgi:hypothetical protein